MLTFQVAWYFPFTFQVSVAHLLKKLRNDSFDEIENYSFVQDWLQSSTPAILGILIFHLQLIFLTPDLSLSLDTDSFFESYRREISKFRRLHPLNSDEVFLFNYFQNLSKLSEWTIPLALPNLGRYSSPWKLSLISLQYHKILKRDFSGLISHFWESFCK